MEYIPEELLREIVLYLEVEDIKNFIRTDINPLIDNIIKNKFFWLEKTKYDDIEQPFSEYINLLDANRLYFNFNGYINKYNDIFDIQESVGSFVQGFIGFKSQMKIYLKKRTNIREFIDTYNLGMMIDTKLKFEDKISSEQLYISLCHDYNKDKQFFCYDHLTYTNRNFEVISGGTVISDDEFKFLCMKLQLLGISLNSDVSDLDERFLEYAENY